MFGESNIGGSTTAKWRFEYAVNVPTSLLPDPNPNNISDTVSTNAVSTDVEQVFPVSVTAANKTFLYPTDSTTFVIPASALCGGAIVNFKLTRPTTTPAGTYANNLAIGGIFWKFV
jgi:hypothetical protein